MFQGIARCFDRYECFTIRSRWADVDISLDGFYPALEAGEITHGMVLIFRYQGPKGAPGMPEMLGTLINL